MTRVKGVPFGGLLLSFVAEAFTTLGGFAALDHSFVVLRPACAMLPRVCENCECIKSYRWEETIMDSYALCGKFIVEPRDRDALATILSTAADLMARAEGCRTYIVYTEPADDSAVWVTELWDSQEEHDQSLALPGVSDLIAQARPLIRGIEQHVLVPVRGKGF